MATGLFPTTSLHCIAILLLVVGLPFAWGHSEEYNELCNSVEASLTYKPNDTYTTNLQRLAEAFFPPGSSEPVCLGIEYVFPCSSGWEETLPCYDEDGMFQNCSSCNSTYLWTKSNVGSSLATLLLAYHRGFSLKGFEWDRSCLVDTKVEIRLQSQQLLEYDNRTMLEECLAYLTMQVKGYAASKGVPDVDSKYRGYSISWDDSRQDFSRYDAVFTSQVVVLSAFIFLFSLTASNYLYGKLFTNVYDTKKKRSLSPAYPLYWSLVVISLLWNVGPSWVIIYRSKQVLIAVFVLVPLQLLVAISVKKMNEFPIPFFRFFGCIFHTRDHHRCIPRLCISCVARHVVQVLSIWSLLVTFAYLVHYAGAVLLAFYLDPLGTLAKILFVKAVALCLLLNVALLFTVDRPTYKCDKKSLVKVGQMVLVTLTMVSFLPILGYLMFVIGQVVFVSDSGDSWQSVLTLIPPLLLAVVSWYSQGLLFPDGVKDPTHPIKEIEHDLEGNNAHHDGGGDPSTGGKGGGGAKVMMDATPLLPHGGRQSLNKDGSTSSSGSEPPANVGVANNHNYNSISSSPADSGGKMA